MAFRIPFRQLAADFRRASVDAGRLGDKVERNFDEIERALSAAHALVDPPRFTVTSAAATSFTFQAWTTSDYDAAEYDTASAFDLATNTYTIPVSGLWAFTSLNHVNVAADEGITPGLWVNGAESRRGTESLGRDNPDAFVSAGVATEIELEAGDTVQLRVFLRAGANRPQVASAVSNYFSGRWVCS